mmetsp:Transcript_24926/g.53792  ORF Transcript_24926/g.53792 Transcript_24926/m.53792 type:complete len:735 (+) Transcript_24926:379-2583(+)
MDAKTGTDVPQESLRQRGSRRVAFRDMDEQDLELGTSMYHVQNGQCPTVFEEGSRCSESEDDICSIDELHCGQSSENKPGSGKGTILMPKHHSVPPRKAMTRKKTSIKPALNVAAGTLRSHQESTFHVSEEMKQDSVCVVFCRWFTRNILNICCAATAALLLVMALVTLTNQSGEAIRGRRSTLMIAGVVFMVPFSSLVVVAVHVLFQLLSRITYGSGFEWVSFVFYYFSTIQRTFRWVCASLLSIVFLQVVGDLGPDSNRKDFTSGPWRDFRNCLILFAVFMSTYMVGLVMRTRFTENFSAKSYSHRLLHSLHCEHALMILAGRRESSLFYKLYELMLQDGPMTDDPMEENKLSPLLWQQLTNYVNTFNVDGSVGTSAFLYSKRFGRKLFRYLAERSETQRMVFEANQYSMLSAKSEESTRSTADVKHVKLYKSDIMRYKAGEFGEEFTLEEFWNELDHTRRGYISEYRFVKAIEQLFEDRRQLTLSLKNSRKVIRSLDKYLFAVGAIVVFFTALFLYHANFQDLIPLTTFLMGLSFIFSESVKNSFNSIIYLFVVQPYDLGDILIVDDIRYTVRSISLLATVMTRWDGMRVTFEHRTLGDSLIINCSRSENFELTEQIDVDMHYVNREFLNSVQKEIHAYIEAHPDKFAGFALTIRKFHNPLKATLNFNVNFSYRRMDFGKAYSDQSELFQVYIDALSNHGVRFSGCNSGALSLNNSGGEFSSHGKSQPVKT